MVFSDENQMKCALCKQISLWSKISHAGHARSLSVGLRLGKGCDLGSKMPYLICQ